MRTLLVAILAVLAGCTSSMPPGGGPGHGSGQNEVALPEGVGSFALQLRNWSGTLRFATDLPSDAVTQAAVARAQNGSLTWAATSIGFGGDRELTVDPTGDWYAFYVWHSRTPGKARITAESGAWTLVARGPSTFSYYDVFYDVPGSTEGRVVSNGVVEEGLGTRGGSAAWAGAAKLTLSHASESPALTFGSYLVSSTLSGGNVDINWRVDGSEKNSRWPLTTGTAANANIFQEAGDSQELSLDISGSLVTPTVIVYHATIPFDAEALNLTITPRFVENIVPATGVRVMTPPADSGLARRN